MKNWRVGHLINVVLLVGTVIGILQPAWSNDIGLTQIILSLFHPSWSQEFLMRWLLVLAFIALSYSAFIHLIFRNVPLTIISTKMKVTFGDDGAALIDREQLLRANQPNVTAYFTSHSPSAPNGSLLRDRMTASVYCHGWGVKDELELRGNEKKLEALHIFDKPLPYAWYMPLIPSFILNRDPSRLPKFLRKYVIVRKNEVYYLNEFNVPDPVMNFVPAGRYQHFNLTVELQFPHGIPNNFRAREIKNNGVTDIQPQQTANNCMVVRIDKVGAGTIRISWLT